MNDRCREAVEKIKASIIKIEIVKLFKENPYMVDNFLGLSRWLALSEELIAPELEELAALGAIGNYGDGPGAIYTYTRNTQMMICLEKSWTEIEKALAEMRMAEIRRNI